MPGRHIADRLTVCRFLEPRRFLQYTLMRYGSQLASRGLLELKAFSSTCELNHFLEERDELLFDLLCFFVRDFSIKKSFRHELLDVGD